MGQGLIRLEWMRDERGYTISESGSIEPAGGEPRWFTLEGTTNHVFHDFYQSDPTPDGALEFSCKWGMLHRDIYYQNYETGHYDEYGNNASNRSLSEWLSCRLRVVGYMDLVGQGQYEEGSALYHIPDFSYLTAKVSPPADDGGPTIYLDARSLWGFIWTEMLFSTAEPDSLRRCRYCGRFFPLGSHVGRTRKREFCSNRCKMRNHRRKNRN